MTYSIPFRCVGLLWLVAATPLLAQKADSPVPKNSARLLLRVQADAAVDVQGITVDPTDGLRVFQITGLSPNETYRFELRATWRGKEVKRSFELRTGKITALDLTSDFQAQVSKDRMPQAGETPRVVAQPPAPPPAPKESPVVEPKKPIEVVKTPTPALKEPTVVTPPKPRDIAKPPMPPRTTPAVVKPQVSVKDPVSVEKPKETPRPTPPPPPEKPIVKVEPRPVETPIIRPETTPIVKPVTPLAVAIKPGETCLMVIPIDRQGYTGPVTVRVEDLPAKIVTRTVSGLTSRDSVRVELSVLPGASAAVHPGRLLVAGGSNFRLERPVSVSVRDTSAE